MSQSLENLLGRTSAEMIGQPALDFLHPDDVEICLSILEYETQLEPSHRSIAKQRYVRDIRVKMPDDSFRTFEVGLANHYEDPDIGMLLLSVAAPAQHRHLHRFFDNSADQISLPEVLELLLAEFTTADPWQPAAIVFRSNNVRIAQTPNAPEPYGSVPASAFRTRWEHQLHSTSGALLGRIEFLCPFPEPHPFDVEASGRIANIASALIERAQFGEELAAAALVDPLTGISNRRALEQDIRRRSEAAQKTVVVYVDLNKFKQINDQYGHPIGDAVLVTVAQRLQQSLRKGDLVARVGGDEFVVLLTTELESVEEFGKRLHQLISAPMAIEDQLLEVSASIGFGIGDDPDMLLREADSDMLQNKRRSALALHG